VAIVQARITSADEKRYRAFADLQGLSMSELIRRALENEMAGNRETLPFGCLKGKMWIADDFDASMTDFEGAFYDD